jgi:hypothetical protein
MTLRDRCNILLWLGIAFELGRLLEIKRATRQIERLADDFRATLRATARR